MQTVIGIIGGSGPCQIEGPTDADRVIPTTPCAAPADQILTGRQHRLPVAFQPRHSHGHVFTPSAVPYCANIDAMKQVGVTDLIAVSVCGSMRTDDAPGAFGQVDQYGDRTFGREKSFFGSGCAAHFSLAHPTCPRLSALAAAASQGPRMHRGGTCPGTEGPQFSTLAESRMDRSRGAVLIGMTGMPEAKRACEAALCYASVAMITDDACWHPDHGAVDVSQLIATPTANAGAARSMIAHVAGALVPDRAPCPHGCDRDRDLDHAIITTSALRDADLIGKPGPVAGCALNA